MPRNSDLTIVPKVPGSGRPTPPPELSEEEAVIWRDLVASQPAHWFSGTLPILKGLCAHIATMEDLHARLRTVRATSSLKELNVLSRLHARETTEIERLSNALRLTVRARTRAKQADSMRRTGKSSRPWLIRGDDN